jgi:hypothetical protein
MRKLTALLAATTFALSALPAAAGVVIKQKQHVTNGQNSRDSEQTIMVQGNKQKMVTERHIVVTDLDKGMMYVIDPTAKSYFEIEFPPKGQMASMMAASAAAAMNFKSAGKSREIASYKCNDYKGGGHVMAGDYTVTECFSKEAPGAKEFGAFEKNMASKLKGAGATAASGETPEGIPLSSDSTMKMGSVSIPGMSPEQTAKINQMMANRPPVVTSTVVEKVEAKNIADSEFTVPAGFAKRDLPSAPGMGGMRMGGMNAPAPGASPAAASSPAAH